MTDEGQRRPRYDSQLNRIVAPTGPRGWLARYRGWDDRVFMELTIELARQCTNEPGRVSPKVGALVVSNGKVLGHAYRGELKAGEHAEYTLLERKLPEATLAGATLFTTLEPCTDRNPPKIPCVERIVEREIERVVIGVLDPNRAIQGKGENHLCDNGIGVVRYPPDLMRKIREMNREFKRQHSTG